MTDVTAYKDWFTDRWGNGLSGATIRPVARGTGQAFSDELATTPISSVVTDDDGAASWFWTADTWDIKVTHPKLNGGVETTLQTITSYPSSVVGGDELAYSEMTVDKTGLTNTTPTDIPNLSPITFTVANRPVRLELFIPLVQVSSASGIFAPRIVDAAAGATVYASTEWFPGVAFAEQPLTIGGRIWLPGIYTLKAQAKVSAGNYGLKPGTYSTPLYLTAVQM